MTSVKYELNVKRTFLNQLAGLPTRYMAQVLEKVALLRDDPTPHEPLKKRLEGAKDLYRLRSGDYRIFYTFGDGWVSLLGVENRKDAYRHALPIASLPSVSAQDVPGEEAAAALLDSVTAADAIHQAPDVSLSGAPDEEYDITSQSEDDGDPTLTSSTLPVNRAIKDEPLPRAIDRDLLKRLRVPTTHYSALLACHTINELSVAEVPADIQNKVFDCVTLPDYAQVMQQPDLAVSTVDRLRQYAEGEYVNFALRLSPEQDKYVTWGLESTRPMLLKGAAGTGKTTIAIYRAARMRDLLRSEGVANPRILITTYTRALVAYARQLFEAVAGDDDAAFTIQTADSVAYQLLERHGQLGPLKTPDRNDETPLLEALRQAREREGGASTSTSGRLSAREQVAALSERYLLEELLDVIEARGLTEWEAYEVAPRTGRKVPLSRAQRRIVWNIHERFCRYLAESGNETWQQRRARAADLAKALPASERYDAVFIDEAQDLNLSTLRMLTSLCATKGRLFITADSSQSIYGCGFRWGDLQDDLRIRGSVRALRKGFRSTRQIGEAAWSYLGTGALDEDDKSRHYARRGERPRVYTARSQDEEVTIVAKWLTEAAARHRISLSSCAVLCGSRRGAKRIAQQLTERGLTATFMQRDELDLERPGAKVMTIYAAKGLEFPVVILAGFFDGRLTKAPKEQQEEAQAEWLARNRRTLFVGMTRALQSLCVVLPLSKRSPALDGFDSRYWRIHVPRKRILVSAAGQKTQV